MNDKKSASEDHEKSFLLFAGGLILMTFIVVGGAIMTADNHAAKVAAVGSTAKPDLGTNYLFIFDRRSRDSAVLCRAYPLVHDYETLLLQAPSSCVLSNGVLRDGIGVIGSVEGALMADHAYVPYLVEDDNPRKGSNDTVMRIRLLP